MTNEELKAKWCEATGCATLAEAIEFMMTTYADECERARENKDGLGGIFEELSQVTRQQIRELAEDLEKAMTL